MDKLLENKLFRICLISVVVIILIILIIAIFVGSKAKVVTEAGLINAAKRYYATNEYLLPKQKYDSTTLSLATLVSNGYVSSNLEGASCPSYVVVTNMGSKYDYNANIMCDGSAMTLLTKLLSTRVTSGSGLYDYNNSYIFRGENPNNYVSLGNLKWRIIGIDENNNIKLIYDDLYVQYLAWDDRYNKEIDEQRGINDYVSNEKSRLKEYLDSFLSNEITGENFTGRVISMLSKHSACVGKINVESINTNACSNKLDGQLVSTISVNDYVNASLDSNCSMTKSINCQNYNFLNKYGWTINANSANSYTAYYIDEDEGLKTQFTSLGSAVRPVVALKSSTIYVAGTGTVTDPYLIK